MLPRQRSRPRCWSGWSSPGYHPDCRGWWRRWPASPFVGLRSGAAGHFRLIRAEREQASGAERKKGDLHHGAALDRQGPSFLRGIFALLGDIAFGILTAIGLRADHPGAAIDPEQISDPGGSAGARIGQAEPGG